MTFRYPSNVGAAGDMDYVTFTPVEYRSNFRGGPEFGRGEGLGGQAAGESIVLYMPNSTPAVGNQNNWGDLTMAGPLGEFQKTIGQGVADVADSEGVNISNLAERVTNQFKEMRGSTSPGLMGDAAKQFGLQMLPAQLLGATGPQMLAMSRGKVYNPNVELLYTAPGMRSFNFSFKMVPKSSVEAQTINTIIRHFKRMSAPDPLGNGMLKIPHVWRINYMTGANKNMNMNQFKLSACTNVAVQANPGTTMHVSFQDGMPIETVLSLSFREVDIITSADQSEGQGF